MSTLEDLLNKFANKAYEEEEDVWQTKQDIRELFVESLGDIKMPSVVRSNIEKKIWQL